MLRTLRLMAHVGLPLVTLLLSSLWAPTAYGGNRTVLYVDKDAGGSTHDGTSWATAFTTLQGALDWTNAHGATPYEIWVAEGVYYPDEGGSHVANSPDERFRISHDNVQIYGGFGGSETLRSQRNPAVHRTILSGDIDADSGGVDTNTDGNFIAETSADIRGSNAYHVLFLDGETNDPLTTATVIDGLIITAGHANGDTSGHPDGGGLYCAGNGAGKGCSPTIANVTFSGNKANTGGGIANFTGDSGGASSPVLVNVTFTGNQAAGSGGGGMANFAYDGGVSSPVLANVTFSGNTADDGGGMVNFAGHSSVSSPVLTNVTFTGNTADYGGGMYSSAYDGVSSPVLTNVTFTGNQATAGSGGGMYNVTGGGVSSPVLTNVTFSGNQTVAGGGGLANRVNGSGFSSPLLTNVTFTGNTADYGGGMYNWARDGGTSSPSLTNVILWGDSAANGAEIYNDGATPTISYSDIKQDGFAGTGNFQEDPLLSALADHGGGMLTFALLPGSPAIDTGDAAACAAAPVNNLDQRGVVRPQGSGCDIGAYESRGFTLTPRGGTPQSTTVLSAFGAPLIVTAGSAYGEPLGPGGVITLTPPAEGPGLSVTAPFTITTDAAGVATSAVITANRIVGSFNVTATAAGAPAPTVFSLTNTQGTPPRARADVAAVLQDTPLLIDVLANDIPGTNPQLAVYTVTQPLMGGATTIEQSQVRFTPAAGFTGLVAFTSTIQDRAGLASSAAVAVLVTALNTTDGVPQVLPLPDPTEQGGGTFTVPAGTTEMEMPAGAITPAEDPLATYDLVYQELNTLEPPPPGTLFNFGGRAFVLQLFIDAELQTPYTFNVPIYVTLAYDPNVVTDTSKLTLYYYDELRQQWANNGITTVSVDTENHTFRASIAHLSKFAAGIKGPAGLDPNLEPQLLPQLFLPQIQP